MVDGVYEDGGLGWGYDTTFNEYAYTSIQDQDRL